MAHLERRERVRNKHHQRKPPVPKEQALARAGNPKNPQKTADGSSSPADPVKRTSVGLAAVKGGALLAGATLGVGAAALAWAMTSRKKESPHRSRKRPKL